MPEKGWVLDSVSTSIPLFGQDMLNHKNTIANQLVFNSTDALFGIEINCDIRIPKSRNFLKIRKPRMLRLIIILPVKIEK